MNTIEDTCICGAKFRTTAEIPGDYHQIWLTEHKICREASSRHEIIPDKVIKKPKDDNH